MQTLLSSAPQVGTKNELEFPDALLLGRFLLALAIPLALALRLALVALVLFSVSSLSELIQRFFIRDMARRGRLGAVATRLTLGLMLVTMAVQGTLPIWLVGAALARDLLIALDVSVLKLSAGSAWVRSSAATKLDQGVIVLLLVGLMMARATLVAPGMWIEALEALAFVTIVMSVADHVADGWPAAARALRRRNRPHAAQPDRAQRACGQTAPASTSSHAGKSCTGKAPMQQRGTHRRQLHVMRLQQRVEVRAAQHPELGQPRIEDDVLRHFDRAAGMAHQQVAAARHRKPAGQQGRKP